MEEVGAKKVMGERLYCTIYLSKKSNFKGEILSTDLCECDTRCKPITTNKGGELEARTDDDNGSR